MPLEYDDKTLCGILEIQRNNALNEAAAANAVIAKLQSTHAAEVEKLKREIKDLKAKKRRKAAE